MDRWLRLLPIAAAVLVGACTERAVVDSTSEPPADPRARAALFSALSSAGIPLVLDDEVPVPQPGRLTLADGSELEAYAVEAVFEEPGTNGYSQTMVLGWAGYHPADAISDQEFQVAVYSPASRQLLEPGMTIDWAASVTGLDPYLIVVYVDYTGTLRWRVTSASLSLEAVAVNPSSVDCGHGSDSTHVACEASFGTMSGTFRFELRRIAGDGRDVLTQPEVGFALPLVRARFGF